MSARNRHRWAFGLACAATAFVLVAVLMPIRACEDVLTATGSVTDLCARPPLAALAIAFIPAILFLLPDLSEISFLGVSAKRIAEESAKKAEQAQSTAHEAKIEASSATQTTATVGAAVLPVALSKAREAGPEPVEQIQLPADREALVERLLDLWQNQLQPFERLARRARSPASWPALRAYVASGVTGKAPSVAIDPLDRHALGRLEPNLSVKLIEELKEWASAYGDALHLVEITAAATLGATRGASDDDLKQAIQLGESARRALPTPARDDTGNSE